MLLTNTNRIIDKFNKTMTSKAKKNLANKSSSGSLYKSIKLTRVDSKDFVALIELTQEDYGLWVDEGRKAGKGVPPKELKKWIKQKGLVLRDSDNKSLSMTDSRIDSLSFLINRKIKEEGIKPTNFLTDPLNLLFNKFGDDLADAYGQDIIEDMFNDLP